MNLRKYKFFLFGLPKTIRFNFHYLPLKQAVKLPILLTNKVHLKNLDGSVILNGKIKRGLITIGYTDVSISDLSESSLWNVKGTVIFDGSAGFGAGTKIATGENATLFFGNKFNITAKTEIACFKSICFGTNCLLSWDILIMDTDSHPVFDADGKLLNEDRAIKIGNNVWIGCRTLVLKDTEIPDGSIIAAQSVVNKKFDKINCLIGGNPARIIKENIFWNKQDYRD